MTTPHLCAEPYCTNIVDGPGRCPEHAAASTRGTPGYGGSWRRVRDAYIAEHPTCERCGAPAIDVHHRDGQHPSTSGANAWANLEALCRSCHRRATEHAKRQGAPSITSRRFTAASKPTGGFRRKSTRPGGAR